MSTKQATCAERVDAACDSRTEDLRKLWQASSDGIENAQWFSGICINQECEGDVNVENVAEYDSGWPCPKCGEEISVEESEDLGSLHEYGLSFDYVEPDTFSDQPFGYWRYQISWGGPSEEYRLWGGGKVEFVYLDWFDGAPKTLYGTDLSLLREIFEYFLECQEDRHGF